MNASADNIPSPSAGPSLAGRLREYAALGRRFLSWWRDNLVAWLPRRWQALLGLAPDRLLLRVENGELSIRREQGDGTTDRIALPLPPEPQALRAVLDHPRLTGLPRWLVLPAADVLRRHLRLPQAAAERLRDVTGFEIDRQTPFAAADVCHDARVLQRRADRQLDAELVVALRATVKHAVDALGEAGASLAGIDVVEADGVLLGVNLLDPAARSHGVHRARRWNLALAAIAAIALIAAAWQMLDNRRAAAREYSARVEAYAERARQVAGQRQQLADLVEGTVFLDQARAGRPTTVEVLDELSRRLPDDTWLEKVSIEGDRLLLIGYSREASALVGKLDGSALWKSAALTGAVQPDPRSGRDRFSLTAQLVAPAAPATQDGGADGGR
ncbi:general secretion pathway protein GspL [Pseudoxanthomonas kalamensis DSM 18571]|uniref:PilN domain-containing protein n=1 Tax=Pseudoxanthomonas kalamensis TaxID=289483 RepID=UPI001391A06D|nr:PilN domain-containing protein [Pseudoxanthomonas kalamensis]KAF1708870.1 general secretion pathway protein GspL [Pseudoxanthomonas kalamensis DSM 18571]